MRVLLVLVTLSQVSRGEFPPSRDLFTLSWTGGPLVWPSATVRAMYRSSGRLQPNNMLATRAAIFRDEVYVAFPRLRPGVAATLARATLLSPHHEPVFEAFPSWEAQAEGDCQALQSVVDLSLDRKDILWVLDSGVTQALENPVRQCTPKVLGYDLLTGKQVYKIDLSSLTTESSRLQYLVADVDRKDRQFLYISDAANRCILVYNVAEDTGYRVQLPEAVSGEHPDVLHLALAKPRSGGRRLYLGYLGGDQLFSVRTDDLQTGTDHGAIETVGSKPGKMVIIGTDKRSTIYFRYEGGSDVYSWDVSSDLEPENCHLVHKDDSALLATQAVLDPLRGKVRLLQSNVLDFLHQTVGVGAVHVLSSG